MPCDGPHRTRQADFDDRAGQMQCAAAAERGIAVNGRLQEILPPGLLAGKPVPARAHVNGHGHSPAARPCTRRRRRAAAGALMALRALPYPDFDTQAVLPA